MILKPRKIPLSVQKYQALTRSTTSNHLKIPLIMDYALLIDPTITNEKMQDFLQIASANLCTRLIREMNLQSTGKNKGRSDRLH